GETEFVQGIAAECASGRYGDLRAAAGIVGTADLRLGDRVAPVLEAQIAASRQRFRGIRHGAAWTEPGELPTGSAAARAPNRPAVVPRLEICDFGTVSTPKRRSEYRRHPDGCQRLRVA